MTSSLHITRALIISTLAVATASMAAAQSQPPPAQPSAPTSPQVPSIHETVEVVATRTPEAPGEVPIAIETISGDELRSRGVTDLRGALALATGVSIAPGGDGGPASAVPEFWGLKEFDAFLLVVDDVPWGGAFNPALSTLNLNDVERIEILRGPAPVMYGATSFVGVIHVVHKPAAAASRSFGARLAATAAAARRSISDCRSVRGRRASRPAASGRDSRTIARRSAAATSSGGARGSWPTGGCGSRWTARSSTRIRRARTCARARRCPRSRRSTPTTTRRARS